jgi:hypothetical protein
VIGTRRHKNENPITAAGDLRCESQPDEIPLSFTPAPFHIVLRSEISSNSFQKKLDPPAPRTCIEVEALAIRRQMTSLKETFHAKIHQTHFAARALRWRKLHLIRHIEASFFAGASPASVKLVFDPLTALACPHKGTPLSNLSASYAAAGGPATGIPVTTITYQQ